MTSSIDNERTKLAANAFDRASTACLAVGIFAPLAALLQAQGAAAPPADAVILSIGGWFAAAVVLHLLAQRTLGGLKP